MGGSICFLALYSSEVDVIAANHSHPQWEHFQASHGCCFSMAALHRGHCMTQRSVSVSAIGCSGNSGYFPRFAGVLSMAASPEIIAGSRLCIYTMADASGQRE
jgi:hypothetical protein